MSTFAQVVDETALRRKTSVATSGNGNSEVVMKTVGPRRMTSDAAERINASMDQVNLTDDENSPARGAPIRGKHFSKNF